MENLKELIAEIEKIKKQGWIESEVKGSRAVGITFEKALNIPENEFEIPDYGEIEIKTKTINTKGDFPYITLFSATPDSYLFETKRIQKQYGYPYYLDPKLKVFNISVFATQKISLSRKYDFQIKIDRINEKIILCVYNKNGKIIDTDTSWSFKLIEEKLTRKLKYLLFVKAKRKFEHNQVFFKYVEYNFYILKSFQDFITAIENGYVRITFKIGVYTTGPKYGQINDHGTSFDIEKTHIEDVFYSVK